MESAHNVNVLCAAAGRVMRCSAVCREHVLIEAALRTFPASEPGQFAQLLCRDAAEADAAAIDWPDNHFPSLSDKDLREARAYLRRPFSIADQWHAADGSVRLAFVARAVGPGTRWLARLRAGQELNLTGPLGHGFRIPSADLPLVLIGGGGGIPPLLYLTRRLAELGRSAVTVILGSRTRDLLPVRLEREPAVDGAPTPCVRLSGQARFPAIVTSDDGSVGLRGLATDALRAWYKAGQPGSSSAVVFACGPEAMLRAAAELTRQLGLACQLCIERNMGCGLGTCLSCVVRVRDASRPQGWRWALACQEGPVFDRDELLDYSTPTPA